MIEAFDFLRQCNLPSVALRLVLAMIFGGMLGIERAKKGRVAGFRTYMFVCMGAALTVLLSQYESMMLAGQWNDVAQEVGIRTDVSRFGAQVINGIGFFGGWHHHRNGQTGGQGPDHRGRAVGLSLYGAGHRRGVLRVRHPGLPPHLPVHPLPALS